MIFTYVASHLSFVRCLSFVSYYTESSSWCNDTCGTCWCEVSLALCLLHKMNRPKPTTLRRPSAAKPSGIGRLSKAAVRFLVHGDDSSEADETHTLLLSSRWRSPSSWRFYSSWIKEPGRRAQSPTCPPEASIHRSTRRPQERGLFHYTLIFRPVYTRQAAQTLHYPSSQRHWSTRWCCSCGQEGNITLDKGAVCGAYWRYMSDFVYFGTLLTLKKF